MRVFRLHLGEVEAEGRECGVEMLVVANIFRDGDSLGREAVVVEQLGDSGGEATRRDVDALDALDLGGEGAILSPAGLNERRDGCEVLLGGRREDLRVSNLAGVLHSKNLEAHRVEGELTLGTIGEDGAATTVGGDHDPAFAVATVVDVDKTAVGTGRERERGPLAEDGEGYHPRLVGRPQLSGGEGEEVEEEDDGGEEYR